MMHQSNENDDEKKSLAEHIVEQIWVQYDTNNSGDLDEFETKDFAAMVLDFHERNTAKKLEREAKEIPESRYQNVFNECEKN